MKISDLRTKVHTRILALRSVERLINHDAFDSLWKELKAEEIDTVTAKIFEGQYEWVLNWFRKHPLLDLSEHKICELKQIAKDLKIKRFSKLDRDGLIFVILERRTHAEKFAE